MRECEGVRQIFVALLHGKGMGVIMRAGAGDQSLGGVLTGICLFRIVAPELTHRVIGSVSKI